MHFSLIYCTQRHIYMEEILKEEGMRGQMTFTDAEYANRKRVSKREEFLSTMDKLMPRDDWVAAG